MSQLDRCHYCGGANKAVSGPGRWRCYRGVRCEVPADLAIDTCTECGREQISSEEIAQMGASFEMQRLASRPSPTQCTSTGRRPWNMQN